MPWIFLGHVLLLLDFNLSIEAGVMGTSPHVIGLLPTFAGYFLIVKGLRELLGGKGSARSLQLVGLALGTLLTVIYVRDLVDGGSSGFSPSSFWSIDGISSLLLFLGGMLFWLLEDFLLMLTALLFSGGVVRELCRWQRAEGREAGAKRLGRAWRWMALVRLLMSLSFFLAPLFLVLCVASLIFDLLFLAALFQLGRQLGEVRVGG